ncbi:MAG TPA: ImmA/IrrE family metallo-endopeptidase [Nevskiaceae bacterium]|nr:ImmA/IrrE family metallo-endopeptidase [Nevskiaceae bacterium]
MTLQEIRELAEQHARTYNPGNLVPFPHDNVVAANDDLEILFADLEDSNISGAILYKNNTYSIIVNNTKPRTRQHFTIGHELGHYFLHKDVLQKRKDEGIVDGDSWLDGGSNMLFRQDGVDETQLEKEANNFAASLIMPEAQVRKAWKALESIQACARVFKVSVVAMSIRLTQQGIIKD